MKRPLESDFDQVLVKSYGTQVESDLEIIKKKFALVIAAHLFAGTLGGNFLCELNRVLVKGLESEFPKK